MGWYKVHDGMPRAARLAVVARRTGFRPGDILALWIALLDHASQAQPRGSVKDIDAEEMAAILGFEAACVEAALQAFRDKNMISETGLLPDWDKSQKLSTPRTRAHRARAAGESDDARRQRLQNEMMARHKRHGKILAE